MYAVCTTNCFVYFQKRIVLVVSNPEENVENIETKEAEDTVKVSTNKVDEGSKVMENTQKETDKGLFTFTFKGK